MTGNAIVCVRTKVRTSSEILFPYFHETSISALFLLILFILRLKDVYLTLKTVTLLCLKTLSKTQNVIYNTKKHT